MVTDYNYYTLNFIDNNIIFFSAVYVCGQTVFCDALPFLFNGIIFYRDTNNEITFGPYPTGTTAEYECIFGYRLVGMTTRTCIAIVADVGDWTGMEPMCEG